MPNDYFHTGAGARYLHRAEGDLSTERVRANIKVAALKRQGKSSDEVIAEKTTAAFDEKWGHFVIDPVHFIRLVYTGL